MAAAPPTRPALRAKYDQRQQEVIACAARVFAERGFHATSVQDLVEATGLTAGGLYHYMGSKDDLLVRICDQLMAPLLQESRRLVADASRPAADVLRDLVRAWVEHVARNRDLVLVFAQERAVLEGGPPARWRAVRRQRKDFEELLAALLARGAADGSIALRDPDLALRALLGMVNHTATWFRPRGRLDARGVADGYVDLVLGGG